MWKELWKLPELSLLKFPRFNLVISWRDIVAWIGNCERWSFSWSCTCWYITDMKSCYFSHGTVCTCLSHNVTKVFILPALPIEIICIRCILNIMQSSFVTLHISNSIAFFKCPSKCPRIQTIIKLNFHQIVLNFVIHIIFVRNCKDVEMPKRKTLRRSHFPRETNHHNSHL